VPGPEHPDGDRAVEDLVDGTPDRPARVGVDSILESVPPGEDGSVTDPVIPEADLAAHFPAVEAAARERGLVRAELLDDPRQRATALAHLLLEFFRDRLADRPPEAVYWTRFYWHRRPRRTHERLEHGGGPCPADDDTERFLLEDGAELDVDWDRMDPLEARAVADADAALGPGRFERPPFACGDIRPLDRGT